MVSVGSPQVGVTEEALYFIAKRADCTPQSEKPTRMGKRPATPGRLCVGHEQQAQHAFIPTAPELSGSGPVFGISTSRPGPGWLSGPRLIFTASSRDVLQ
ncbi:hypothetical protein GCM10027256_38550 [Novispirillum itersonii subsp. nipponicum]